MLIGELNFLESRKLTSGPAMTPIRTWHTAFDENSNIITRINITTGPLSFMSQATKMLLR